MLEFVDSILYMDENTAICFKDKDIAINPTNTEI